jgi:hypothetical protein
VNSGNTDIYCVSHAEPLVPEPLYDYAIGLGSYRPKRGAHISELDTFWHESRPLAFGAAGNYCIPIAARRRPTAAIIGIFSHRKIVLQEPHGAPSGSNFWRDLEVSDARTIRRAEAGPRDGHEFLVIRPFMCPGGMAEQYAEDHHEVDLHDYLAIAYQLGILDATALRQLPLESMFFPGGCELGFYPTEWIIPALEKLALAGKEFIKRHADRIVTYDNYQVRAVGFLAERLGSYLLLRELQRRFPDRLPGQLIGNACTLVPKGETYSVALVDDSERDPRQR